MGRMKTYLVKCWNSPTLMTWGSFLSKSLSLIVVLPLLLTKLGTAEISLWYLFMTIIGLQSIVDAGFSPTFIRVIAYVKGGVRIGRLKECHYKDTGKFDIQTLNQVYSTMSRVYRYLGMIWASLLVVAGTIALQRPVAAVPDKGAAWFAWSVIVIASGISFQGTLYSSYLQGMNQVALVRRWETLTSLAAIITSFLVLLADGGLLGLVIANQAWLVINVARDRWLARWTENGILLKFTHQPFNMEVFDAVWPSAWRSGLGILMSYGLIQASGIIYAQIGNAASVATYLLGLRLIQTVSQFSQAPFYSKIPLLARLYAEDRHADLLQAAKRGMTLAHWTYVSGFVGLGLAGAPILMHIGSHAPFPGGLLWSLMGLAFFLERYGAMHIQLYSTTNHIIWHIANGGMGVIYLLTSCLLLKSIGVYAFAVGMIAGYLGFYCWFAAYHSYRAFSLKFMAFEIRTSFAPSLLGVLGSFLIFLNNR